MAAPSYPELRREASYQRIERDFIADRDLAAAGSLIGRMTGAPGYQGPPDVPMRAREEPLPHDGLFIRRNNAFGTKLTLGIADLIEQGVLVDQEQVRSMTPSRPAATVSRLRRLVRPSQSVMGPRRHLVGRRRTRLRPTSWRSHCGPRISPATAPRMVSPCRSTSCSWWTLARQCAGRSWR